MPIPALAIAGGGALLSGLGSLFGKKAEDKKAKAEYENQRQLEAYLNQRGAQDFEADEKRRLLKGSFFNGLAKAFGLEGLFPQGYQDFAAKERGYIDRPISSYTGTGRSTLGGILGGAGNAAFQYGLGQALYGNPGPSASSMPNFGPPADLAGPGPLSTFATPQRSAFDDYLQAQRGGGG